MGWAVANLFRTLKVDSIGDDSERSCREYVKISDKKFDVSPNSTVKRGGMLALSGQGIKLCLQLGAMAVLARLLPPADFGLLSLIMPIVAFFAVFRDVGLTSATIFSEDITEAEVSSLFWINVVAGLILGAILCAGAPFASAFYKDPRLTYILDAMALTFFFNGVGAQYQALFQRHFRYFTLTAIDVGSNVFGTVAGLLAAFMGLDYWSLVIMPIATQGVSLIATLLVSNWHPSAPRWEKRTGSMTRFGSEIAGFQILNYFSRNLDNLLIGKVWGMEALAYYGRAYSLMMAPLSQIIYPLGQVVVPVLTRINTEPVAYVATYKTIMRSVMMVCVPIVTALIVSRFWVVDLLLGPKWRATAPIFLALGFSAFVQPMNNSLGWLLISQGRSRTQFIWGWFGSTLIVLCILFGLQFSAQGVAISYSLGQIFILTPVVWLVVCHSGFVRVRDLISVSVPYYLVCAVGGLSFEAFRQYVWPNAGESILPIFGIGLALGWILFVGVALLYLNARTRAELKLAFRAIYDLRLRPAKSGTDLAPTVE